MNKKVSIRAKALFLLLVFGLNTVVGFACSMGIDMGFNRHHHDHQEEGMLMGGQEEGHHHGEGEEHEQGIGKGHHDQKDGHKGGCCNDEVIRMQQLDKSLGGASMTSLAAPVWVLIVPAFFSGGLLTGDVTAPYRGHICYYYPPPPDIRVFIQSFQI